MVENQESQITVFCNLDDNPWLSFLRWLPVQRDEILRNIGRPYESEP